MAVKRHRRVTQVPQIYEIFIGKYSFMQIFTYIDFSLELVFELKQVK